MKITPVFLISIGLILILCQCTQHVRINADKEPSVSTSPAIEVSNTPSTENVRIAYSIQADFPEGPLSPDVVYMDGKILAENSFVVSGTHTFEVEKKGYQKKSTTVLVSNSDNNGVFFLNVKLEAKERLILFDIRDEATNAVIKPDTVAMVDSDEGDKKETLGDRSYVKPGRKKVVIQKAGYEPISADVTIKPDDAPYSLEYKLKLAK